MAIRLRIFLLVVLASLPALGFLGMHLFDLRTGEIARAKQDLAALAALAAHDLEESLRGAHQFAAGCVSVIAKPYHYQDFLAAVAKALGKGN